MASAGMELRLYKLCRNGDHQMMFTLAQPLAGSCLTISQRRKDLPEIPNARFLAAPLETREGLFSSTQDHAQADRRRLADFSLEICFSTSAFRNNRGGRTANFCIADHRPLRIIPVDQLCSGKCSRQINARHEELLIYDLSTDQMLCTKTLRQLRH